MKWTIPAVILFLLVPFCLAADKKEEKPKPAESIDELRQQIEKILKDTHTNGVSVAIVHKDGPEWVTGVGMADLASNRPATADTLFRIGSTSKAFASLSILLLADQGKLSLEDPVHKLAPDVWFENRWESTDPVRVVNLLEHTTGWDDLRLREYAKQAPDSMSVSEGLDYAHKKADANGNVYVADTGNDRVQGWAGNDALAGLGGNVAAFLMSDLAAGITGEIIYVDCGYNVMGG